MLQITNGILFGPEDDSLIEGASDYAYGPCAVIIHSKISNSPDQASIKALAKKLEAKGIKRLLVFVNALIYKGGCFGDYRYALESTSIRCLPQHLEDISFNVAITTNTYHRFQGRVSWIGGILWIKEEGPFYQIHSDGTREKMEE